MYKKNKNKNKSKQKTKKIRMRDGIQYKKEKLINRSDKMINTFKNRSCGSAKSIKLNRSMK